MHSFCLPVSPGTNGFSLEFSNPNFAQWPAGSTLHKLSESGQAITPESTDSPSREGPADYLWEFLLSANL